MSMFLAAFAVNCDKVNIAVLFYAKLCKMHIFKRVERAQFTCQSVAKAFKISLLARPNAQKSQVGIGMLFYEFIFFCTKIPLRKPLSVVDRAKHFNINTDRGDVSRANCESCAVRNVEKNISTFKIRLSLTDKTRFGRNIGIFCKQIKPCKALGASSFVLYGKNGINAV